jgi:hypothetical protein
MKMGFVGDLYNGASCLGGHHVLPSSEASTWQLRREDEKIDYGGIVLDIACTLPLLTHLSGGRVTYA